MRISDSYRILIRAFFALSLVLQGCGDDNSTSPSSENNSTSQTEADYWVMGMGSGEASFWGSDKLDGTKITGGDYWEHDNQSIPIFYKKWVFVLEPLSTHKIFRYTIDENNSLEDRKVFNFPGGSGPASITFADENTAYISLENSGKISVFDPTKMEQKSEIDLSELAVKEDGSPEPSFSYIRDDKLFVALSQKSSLMSAYENSYVAIVDLKTEKVDSVIMDKRMSSLGSTDAGVRTKIVDEEGHMYFYSPAMWGYQPGLKGGFLRIKKGEFTFDPDYYFDLENTPITGKEELKGNYGMNFVYTGSGEVYSMLNVPSLSSNPPDYLNDRTMVSVKIDMFKKTIKALPMPISSPWAGAAIDLDKDGNLYFGLSPQEGKTGVYRYSPQKDSLESEPVSESNGPIYFLKRIEQ